MGTIYHQVCIKASLEKVYAAIANPARIGTWWKEQIVVPTESGLLLEHDFGPPDGVLRLRIVERIPYALVHWECISTHPESSSASAWTGTQLLFELKPGSDTGPCASTALTPTTILDFRQLGYDHDSKFYPSNKFGWALVLEKLKKTLEWQRDPSEGTLR